MFLRISREVIAEIIAHAHEEAPRECCGLLIGSGDEVDRSVRATNLEPNTTRYLIDPKDHFAALRAARAKGREVIGAYHSHPASAPVPSPTDIEEAHTGSDFIYVIVSPVNDDIAAYRIVDGATVRIRLQAVGPSSSAT